MDYDALEKRLREPPFGTETSERNLMMAAADAIADLRARNAALVEVLKPFSEIDLTGSGFPEGLAFDVLRLRVALAHFTIAKADPLREAWAEAFGHAGGMLSPALLVEALAARGLEIVEKKPFRAPLNDRG